MIAARIHVGLISKLASLTAFLESCGAYLVLAAAATVAVRPRSSADHGPQCMRTHSHHSTPHTHIHTTAQATLPIQG